MLNEVQPEFTVETEGNIISYRGATLLHRLTCDNDTSTLKRRLKTGNGFDLNSTCQEVWMLNNGKEKYVYSEVRTNFVISSLFSR